MTPQQRHIEAADKIVKEQLSSFYVSPRSDKRFDLRDIIAQVLADAENKAAWEGWDRHRNWAKAFWAQDYGDVSIVISSMEERYGPRPIDAAKEVGNE